MPAWTRGGGWRAGAGAQPGALETVPYRFGFTYDIRPASASGTYFAAGVLTGTTLGAVPVASQGGTHEQGGPMIGRARLGTGLLIGMAALSCTSKGSSSSSHDGASDLPAASGGVGVASGGTNASGGSGGASSSGGSVGSGSGGAVLPGTGGRGGTGGFTGSGTGGGGAGSGGMLAGGTGGGGRAGAGGSAPVQCAGQTCGTDEACCGPSSCGVCKNKFEGGLCPPLCPALDAGVDAPAGSIACGSGSCGPLEACVHPPGGGTCLMPDAGACPSGTSVQGGCCLPPDNPRCVSLDQACSGPTVTCACFSRDPCGGGCASAAITGRDIACVSG